MTAGSRFATVLVAVLVVLSSVAAGGAIVGAQSDAGSTNGTNASTGIGANPTDTDAGVGEGQGESTIGASQTGIGASRADLSSGADEVYVESDGDAVLAYESPSNGARANYGLNVSEGLFHALVASNLSRPGLDESRNVSADLSAMVTNDTFAANGSLSAPRPDSISDLSANLTGLQTDENARYDAAIEATVAGESMTRLPVERLRTVGNLTTTGADFEAALEAHAEFDRSIGPAQHHRYRLTEDDGTYTLNASQQRVVSPYAASQWESREQARRTLQRQYTGIATSLGGTADLTIESYEFTQRTGDGSRLDVEYTVTYEGVKSALIDRLRTSLTESRTANVSQSAARNLSTSLQNFTVEELFVSYDQGPDSADAAMRADLNNYTDAVIAGLGVAESANTSALGAGAVPAGAGATGVGGVGAAGIGGGDSIGAGVTQEAGAMGSANESGAGNVSFGQAEGEGATMSGTETEGANAFGTESETASGAEPGTVTTQTGDLGAGVTETDAGGVGSSGTDAFGTGSANAGAIGSEAMAGGPSEANIDAQLQRSRDQLAAQQAANLTRQYTFTANVTRDDGQELSIDAESHYRTTNWDQYTEELNQRGINRTDVRYELHAATEGERINVTAGIEISEEDLLQRATDRLLNASSGAPGTSATGTTGSTEYIEAFREAGFRKGKLNVSLADDRVRLETGAAFENMSALRDAFAATEQARALRSVVGRTDDDTVASYVRLDGAVPANASESQVRQLSGVSDDTAVHMPGSWNRSFPAMNTSEANDYLGVAGASTSGLVGPGFGIGAAVLAVLAVALLAARRRR